jgi:hypothetical protein
MSESERQVVHVRTIRAEVARVAANEIEVTGRLVDDRPGGGPSWIDERPDSTVHDMAITLRVRHPDLTITAASASMTTHPYTLCADAVPPLQQLVGLSVAHGFTRAVNERFGRRSGCSHLTALIHALGPVVRQGAGAAFHEEDRIPEPDEAMWWVNTCQAWRDDGELVARVRAGDVAGLKSYAARKRKP